MNLGIFGDSFASMPDPIMDSLPEDKPWMELVKENLNCSMKIHAQPGTSLWFSFEQFMKYHEKYTHIVFCYTSPDRLNYMPEHLARFSNISSEKEIQDSNVKEELLVIIAARKLLYNKALDLFIFTQIFEKVNEICFVKNIKLVNLFIANQNTHQLDLNNRKGNCLLNLVEISLRETEILDRIVPKLYETRCCHMSRENNIVLSEIILDSLHASKYDIISLEKNKNFVFSKEISNRYFKV
jgi:hypothetical protein